MFFGFSACALPQNIVPDWLYYPVFCPSGEVDGEGRLRYANYGTRKIEAALLSKGFLRKDIIVAHPDHLNKVVSKETKIVGITSNDPLGIGPVTSTYAVLLGGEGRMAVKLRQLLNQPILNKIHPKIFLGGPGAWQLLKHPEKRKALGIDCVVVGEGEVTVPELFSKVLQDDFNIPEIVEGEIAGDSDIADIVNGSIIGLVEATRGCARSCAFCVPSLKKVRSRPLDRILHEVRINLDAGNPGVVLHAEDILLYQSDGLDVNPDAVVELFERVHALPEVQWVSASHVSLSSAVSAPETIRTISKILELGTPKCPQISFQVGIETASSKLINKHMRGKVYPFAPEEWSRVVEEGFELLSENHIVSCSTVMLGLPGEDENDIMQTLDVVKRLEPYRSIIVPLLFTPMETTRLEYAKPLHKDNMSPLHHELFTACWAHNLNWFPRLWKDYSHDHNLFVRSIINMVIKLGTGPVRRKIHRYARQHGARV